MKKHPSIEQIESYVIATADSGSLNESNAAMIAIEEHLLWCQPCLMTAEREDQFVLSLRLAASALKGGNAKSAAVSLN